MRGLGAEAAACLGGGGHSSVLLRFLSKQLGIDRVGSWILSSLWFATEASITRRGDLQ